MALHAAEPMGTRPSGQGTRRVTARFRRDVTQTVAMTGRFAPSPTGALHVGNLRTALIAWLAARSAGERFVLRMEDLDRVTSSAAHERSQERDLAAVGIDWDGAVWRQSERFGVYDAAILRLTELGMTYDCFCSRREIREAVAAPHGPDTLVYPGTCRDLTADERIRRGRSRQPAVRFRAGPDFIAIDDHATHWIIEAKMDKEMSSDEVQGKREAARRWANYVSADEQVGMRWRYLLASETDIRTAKGSWAALKGLGGH